MPTYLRTTDPLLSQEAEESIEQQLAAEHDPQYVAVLLRSIGNTRNASFSGTILAYLNNEDEWVRTSAVKAYSQIEGPQQEEIMTTQLAKETAPDVKREIYHALSQLPISPATPRAVSLLLADEQRTDVRRELILFVGPYAQRDSQVRKTLATHARGETDDNLVQLIGRFLKM